MTTPAEDNIMEVSGLSKTFKLPHEKNSSIKGSLINVFSQKKGYEIQKVLKDVSFEVKRGEFFGIVGRNGSGKSTLLKLLAGIYVPTTGSVKVNGKLTPFIELGVGFNPELTGRENVFLNGALLGFTRKEMNEKYDDIVKFAELERFMDQKLKNYSSGMQVRLAFSIAIRAETDILLIDEVLAVGDQSFQEKCFKYFSDVKQSGTTVVFVTHDMSNVERFCDRVLLLDKDRRNNGIYDIPTAVAYYNELNHPQKTLDDKPRTRSQKDLYIRDVELINSKGNSVKKFRQGDSMTIRIKVGRNKKVISEKKGITLGLAVYDTENVNLAGPNTKHLNFTAGQEVFEYKIEKLPFNMGQYRLTVALFDKDIVRQYDILDEVGFFVNTDEVQYGKINLEATWN